MNCASCFNGLHNYVLHCCHISHISYIISLLSLQCHCQFEAVNLDVFTETFNMNFYFNYLTRWPECCAATWWKNVKQAFPFLCVCLPTLCATFATLVKLPGGRSRWPHSRLHYWKSRGIWAEAAWSDPIDGRDRNPPVLLSGKGNMLGCVGLGFLCVSTSTVTWKQMGHWCRIGSCGTLWMRFHWNIAHASELAWTRLRHLGSSGIPSHWRGQQTHGIFGRGGEWGEHTAGLAWESHEISSPKNYIIVI